MGGTEGGAPPMPQIVPLGECALLVRFGQNLDDAANRRALSLAMRLASDPITAVVEVVPSLVSVLVRYDPAQISSYRLAGEISLRVGQAEAVPDQKSLEIDVRFDGADLTEVAAALGMGVEQFIACHNEVPLRVLTTGFAPGFVYCGFHPQSLVLPRRTAVRARVPAGSVLFAAGQTAIAATDIPTGWHVIGQTDFRNFRPDREPPTQMRAGDLVRFRVVP